MWHAHETEHYSTLEGMERGCTQLTLVNLGNNTVKEAP